MVALHIIQGITVRYSGPALLIVWMWRFGLFLPDIIKDPANIFDPTVAVADLEAEPFRLWCSIAFGGGYALLYIWFVLAHKPRAVPVIEDSTIVRYTEAKKWRSDKSSSFNPFVMGLSVLVNVLIVFLFIANAGGIIYTQGWEETPIIVKILLCICIVPFGLGFLDGLTRFDFRCFFNLLLSAIPALPMMVWFTVWLPAYATTRASDLTWGNRGGSNSLDVSDKALERAQRGSMLAWSLILSNMIISGFLFGDMSDFTMMRNPEDDEEKPWNAKKQTSRGSGSDDEKTLPDVMSDKEGNESQDGDSRASSKGSGESSPNDSYRPPSSVVIKADQFNVEKKSSF
eukprot:scaffold9738_cov132-Amphora_coffeaeformis.AAC.1